MLEGVTDYVMLLDRDWRITYVNAEARRLLAHEPTLVGRSLWNLFPKSYSTEAREIMEHALATDQATRLQFYGPDLEGWFDLNIKPIPNGIEIAFHDISDQRHASAQLVPAPTEAASQADATPTEHHVNFDWLAEQMSRLAEQISQVSSGTSREAVPLNSRWSDRRLARMAADMYRDRRRRRDYFPGIELGEPQWDILLDLFVQTVAGQPVSVSSACIAADVPDTTALRALQVLIANGLVKRKADVLDKRRAWVELTPLAKRSIVAFLTESALARLG